MISKLCKIVSICLLLCALSQPSSAVWVDSKEHLAIPDGTSMIGDTIYFCISSMDFERYRSMFIGYERFNWKKAVIDLNTGGGSLFDAMGMVSIFQEQQSKGKIIEIRGRGIIASAGLIILVSGSPGHRLLDPNSFIMFHEMWSIKFFAIETPSDKEQEALVMRQIQDRINKYISSHSLMSADELSNRIKKKEFWMSADEAIKFGFADKTF